MALTRSLILYNGSDSTPTTDYTDWTDWEQTELTSMANLGEAGAGQWWVRDEGGVIPDSVPPGRYQAGHNVVIVTVGSNTIARTRIANSEQFRGRQKAGRAAEMTYVLEDQNSHLRGIIVHNWVRPAETDAARAQALVAGYLSGNPRVTTNLNGSNLIITGSNTISLPAKTYSGVTPFDVMQELSSNADKEFFVTIDNELAYFGHDYTGYSSLLRISDDPADANSTTYAPWEPRSSGFSREILSALRVYYGTDKTSSTTRLTNSNATSYDYWEDVFWDSESITAAQAAARAQKILDYRRIAGITYTCSIGPMSGDEVWKIKAGQLINFKARGARGGRGPTGTYLGDSFLSLRIREIRWTMPSEDLYIARLELERPIPKRGANNGSQALSTAPKPAPTTQPDTIVSPTVIYHTLFTTDNKDVESDTYSFGLARSGPGVDGYGDILDGTYGRNSAGNYQSAEFPISALTQYSFVLDGYWIYDPSIRGVTIDWRDSGHNLLRTDTWINGSGYGINTRYNTLSTTVTSPSSAAYVVIQFSHFAGFFADNIYIETPGSVTSADNDPYALIDPGSSPYYALSDDPRFTAVDEHVITRLSRTMTNASGATLSAGDIVIGLAGTADNSVTTTTTANYTGGRVGIVLTGGSAGADVVVAWEGVGFYAPNIASGTPAAGDYLFTSSTAGAATYGTTRAAGAFGRIISTDGTSIGTVDLWGETDTTGSGSSVLSSDKLQRDIHGYFMALIHTNAAGWTEQAATFLSADGVSWSLAYPTSPITGSTNDRDPVLLHYDGQWFIARTGGSTYIPIFGPSSTMGEGSFASLVHVDCSSISGLTACWAPKWFVDSDGSVHLLFSAQHGSQTIYEVHPTNRTLTTWSTPVAVTGLTGTSDIDPFLMLVGSTYYLFYKNDSTGAICLATSSSPFSGYTVIKTGDWAGWASAGASIEGPHVVRLDDGRYRMYFSHNSGYTGVDIWYSDTVVADLLSGWTAPVSMSDFSGYNHVSVYRIPATYDHARDLLAHASIIPALGTPNISLGTAVAAGTATTALRTDATIAAFDATVPVTQAFSDAAAAGTATKAARRDHVHGMPASPTTPTVGDPHQHIVDEQFNGDGSTTVFPLANTAAVDSVMAWVSGTRTPVTLGGTSNDEITFGAAPASGTANISVDYAARVE